MIKVHHLNNSRSQRVLWLLEETGQDYEIVKYERDPQTFRAPDTLKAVHPLGKSPVITDGNVTMAESGAIIEYLVERYGPDLSPERGSAAHREYLHWLHFAEGSVMPPLLLKLVAGQIEKARVPFFIKPVTKGIAKKLGKDFVTPELDRLFNYMETALDGRDWFAGDTFSAADIQMSFPLEAAAARAGLDKRYANLTAFLSRIHDRPAYQRAIERGGAYGIIGD